MTTVTLLHYSGLKNRAWAFTQMGLAPARLAAVGGLQFGRLMGSGGGNGFSLKPNWGLYAWVAHWEDRAAADRFFEDHPWYRKALRHSDRQTTYFLEATMTHGEWGGGNPFTASPEAYDAAQPVAVITRATIRTRKLLDFWRYVPQTSASVLDHPERSLSVGIGEYPVFMQATFSVWSSGAAMTKFAYRSDRHAEVVKLTRERDWYKEEMFTRFKIIEVI